MEIADHSWLNREFLQHVIQKDCEEKVNITSFTTSSAVPPGTNYTSIVYRVQVNYQLQTTPQEQAMSLIVKKPIETGIIAKMSESCNFLDKEPLMYGILLPKMYQRLNLEFGPKSLISPIKNTLVMKDLKEGGYTMCKSDNQLDYSHCEQVFQTVAKFHAASVSCYHEDPQFVAEKVGVDQVWADGHTVSHWVTNGLQAMAKTLKEVHVDEKFEHFLTSNIGCVWEAIKVQTKPKLVGLNVLNHGDLWMGNMMFKHDDSKNALDVKLLDFQISKLASPVIDLIYFIWTSANEDVRQNRQKDLYLTYLQTLNNTLEQLGCPERYTLEGLRTDLKASKEWALVVVCAGFPLMISPSEDALDMATFTEEDFASHKFRKLYEGKRFRALLPNLTAHFAKFFLSNKTVLN